jgi:hypothetical protein
MVVSSDIGPQLIPNIHAIHIIIIISSDGQDDQV